MFMFCSVCAELAQRQQYHLVPCNCRCIFLPLAAGVSVYRFVFIGREVGAIGVSSKWSRDVWAESEEAARLKLYETHEHILVNSVYGVAHG